MSSFSSSKPVTYMPPHLRRKDSGISSPTPSPPSSPPKASASLAWRIGAKPLSSDDKGMPSFEDLELGMVLYLPAIPPPSSSRMHKVLVGKKQEPWNHAVVVVGKWSDPGEECVEIRICTSFNGKHVEEACPNHQGLHMLAANSEDNKPHGTTSLATIIGHARFSKRTYINLSADSHYPIEYKHLDLWEKKSPMKFDDISLQRIRSEANRIQVDNLKPKKSTMSSHQWRRAGRSLTHHTTTIPSHHWH